MCLLSEKGCSILLFPFVNQINQGLVKALLLPELPLWASTENMTGLTFLNSDFLVLLLLLCGEEGQLSFKHSYPLEGTRKALLKEKIQTVKETMAELLAEANERVREAKERAERAREAEERAERARREAEERAERARREAEERAERARREAESLREALNQSRKRTKTTKN